MSDASRSLLLFPGALGDLICFLPTVAALIQRHGGKITLVTKPEWQELLAIPNASLVSIDRSEIADLFTSGRPLHDATKALFGGHSHAYSWTGASEPAFAERLAAVIGDACQVYRFRGMDAGEHAVDYYARCAGVDPLPFAHLLRVDTEWFARFRQQRELTGRLLVVHPGSGSAAKNWTGFAELVAGWRQRSREGDGVIVLRGPAEETAEQIGDALTLSDLTLPQVAALLEGCDAYAGNDSGISHLAGAVGARGVVLFGSTDPRTWAPRNGRLTVVHAPATCGACGPLRFCTHRLGVGQAQDKLDS
jgi:ADP-heptose:LPS heptosyltransferase